VYPAAATGVAGRFSRLPRGELAAINRTDTASEVTASPYHSDEPTIRKKPKFGHMNWRNKPKRVEPLLEKQPATVEPKPEVKVPAPKKEVLRFVPIVVHNKAMAAAAARRAAIASKTAAATALKLNDTANEPELATPGTAVASDLVVTSEPAPATNRFDDDSSDFENMAKF
jgi:hypothetical protein